jgi:selenocysteine lyase/cysteine desulfurase
MTDIKAVRQLSQKYGIPLIVDTYQSAGSMPINFDDVGADFMVGGFLKYMLGLPGIGFLLVNSAASYVPTQTGWFAAQDIFAMQIDKYEPSLDARRFEGGTPPIPNLYAATAGLSLLLEVGFENAWKHTQMIHHAIRDELEDLGGKIVTPQLQGTHGALLAVKVEDEQVAVSAFGKEGVVLSSRGGNLRLSPHFYNSYDDLSVLFESLRRHKHLLS